MLIILLGGIIWFSDLNPFSGPEEEIIENHNVLLQQVESIGKIELVKFNLKDIFEYKEVGKGNLIIKMLSGNLADADVEVVLIAQGEVVGCIDMSQIVEEHLSFIGDTIMIDLPEPEICYYKINHNNTRIYNIEYGNLFSRFFPDEKQNKDLVQKAYRKAEEEIRKQAINMGILEQTRSNAELVLKPWLESITLKTIIFRDQMDDSDLGPQSF